MCNFLICRALKINYAVLNQIITDTIQTQIKTSFVLKSVSTSLKKKDRTSVKQVLIIH